ncbi:DUF4911 domain-containing protein [uncultured Veillonella sp.]|uniref:DUF4911 domain-containing protein n=1 Tax=uncultured Veillonella sp. TaxID=159268 RepID=UPI0025CD16F6|nr:DUF4911 domain-containing protein [uncultured Veillonella sp.]MDY3973115.1 DUF4911 domain-containing protein [Veillonella caviae]
MKSICEESYVYFRIDPCETNYVNRILEGYEYLGVMTTLEGSTGLCMVRSTPDTAPVVVEVLQSLDVPIDLISYEEIQKNF